MVQLSCYRKYGFVLEVYVYGPLGRGYLDLYDKEQKAYYEVKSANIPAEVYEFQLLKYNTSTIRNTIGNRIKLGNIDAFVGTTPKQGLYNKDIEGHFFYGIYDVDYHCTGVGEIKYTTRRNGTREAEYQRQMERERQERAEKREYILWGGVGGVLVFGIIYFFPASAPVLGALFA